MFGIPGRRGRHKLPLGSGKAVLPPGFACPRAWFRSGASPRCLSRSAWPRLRSILLVGRRVFAPSRSPARRPAWFRAGCRRLLICLWKNAGAQLRGKVPGGLLRGLAAPWFSCFFVQPLHGGV